MEITVHQSSKTAYGREGTLLVPSFKCNAEKMIRMGLRLCISKKLQGVQVLLALAPQSESQGIRKLAGQSRQAQNEGRGF